MRARDIMTAHVISVGPDATVDAVANTLTGNGVSAVPVIAIDGRLLGIVSEGDLIRRSELKTTRGRSWWLYLLTSTDQLAADFAKSRAVKVKDIMTKTVLTVEPDTPLHDIADILERHGIKRVPVIEEGRVVGIVSRANLIQALASLRKRDLDVDLSDDGLRARILDSFKDMPWASRPMNILVHNGEAELWGCVYSDEERKAVRVAAESTAGVTSVKDNLRVMPALYTGL
jgi:CBS domain-containing protein